MFKSLNNAAVLYGCKTWTLILRKEHGLRVFWVFVNRVLRRILGPKREEVAGG
jgi:hypothetical protein